MTSRASLGDLPLPPCFPSTKSKSASVITRPTPRGFVHHANYFKYFEEGRTELLRADGYSYREIE